MPNPVIGAICYWFLAVFGLLMLYVDVRQWIHNRRFAKRLRTEDLVLVQQGHRIYTTLHALATAWSSADVQSHVERHDGISDDEARRLLAVAILYVNVKEIGRTSTAYRKALIDRAGDETL
jgi:hypothetical protein